MARKKKIIDKKVRKLAEGKCRLCHSDLYVTLDVHRINPGAQGGKYTKHNTVVVCCLCHRRIHAGEIEIDGWFLSTGGWVLRAFIEGVEGFY